MGMFVRLLNVSLIFIILILGAFVILTGSKEIFGYRILTVQSGSMEPTIPTGALILVGRAGTYNKSDIVAYGSLIRKNALITHRIIDIANINGKTLFVLKGDANKQIDIELVPSHAIAGKYLGGIPLVGYPVQFARTPMGVILMIIIPGTLIVYEEIRNLRARLSKKKGETV